MLISTLILSVAIAGSEAYHLAERVSHQVQKRAATYQGAWPLFTEAQCPQEFSQACGSSTTLVQSCCPTGNTCFGGIAPYCCPTAQDCKTFVNTFPVCADLTSNMFLGQYNGFFCCKNGLTGVIPSSDQGLCQAAGQVVPVSLLATMTSQVGGTSVTPFGGFGTATGAAASAAASATNTAAGSQGASATAKAGSAATPATAGSAAATSTGTSGSDSPKSGWNPGNGAYVGLAIAAAFLLGVFYITWSRLSKRHARKQALLVNNPSYGGNASYTPAPQNGRSSYVHQYVPPGQNMPPSGPSPGWQYDPVLERVSMVSPMSPRTPSSPAPEYKAVDAHEMSGRLSVAEVPAASERRNGSTSGRVEMG